MVFFFFFSSRGRHTRLTCDWSSDVCSSDLAISRAPAASGASAASREPAARPARPLDRKSVVEGKSVDLGGRRIVKKKSEIPRHNGKSLLSAQSKSEAYCALTHCT